jgi:hypothetical protein
MSRRIMASVFLLAVFLGLLGVSAQEKEIEAGAFANFFPIFDYTNRAKITSTISDAEFGAYYAKPTFLSGGINLKMGHASLVGIMEFQQDIWSKLDKQSWINLPDSETGFAPDVIGLGTFYPNVGYAAWESDVLRVSFGRRKIKSGPGTYGLGISSGNPFYDHVAASFSLPVGKGRLAYDYVAVGIQRWANTVGGVSGEGSNEQPKYLFFHRGSWTGKVFSIGLSEYNLLADAYPDFQDMSPFVFYHNMFNNHHNVMVGIDFKATPIKPVSIFGEFVMDDFQIGAEGGNPNAFGFMAGLEWRVLPGSLNRKPKFFDADYVYDVGRSSKAEGLAIRAEGYLLSTYLWRRNQSVSNEAFTSRYHVMSNWSNGSRLVEPFLVSPLGPDTILGRIAASWMKGNIDANLALEYRIKGSQSELKTYDVSTLDATAWLWPSAPTTTEISVRLNGDYQLDPRSIASAGIALAFKPAGSELSLSVGYARQMGKGPSIKF